MIKAKRAGIALLIASLTLTACEKPAEQPDAAAYSSMPLVSESENTAASALRPGLWLKFDPDCAVDTGKPRGAWPDCARAVVVRGDQILRFYSADFIERERFRLADGLPMILQVQRLPVEAPAEWRYYGLRPTLEGGQIVEYSSWWAMCQPNEPATEEALDAGATPISKPPVKGALPLDEDGRCRLRSRDSLRSTVIASEGWTVFREHLRWVRSAEQ